MTKSAVADVDISLPSNCTSPFIICIIHWPVLATATHIGGSIPNKVTLNNIYISSTIHNCTAAGQNTVPVKEAVADYEHTSHIYNTISVSIIIQEHTVVEGHATVDISASNNSGTA